MTLNADRLIEKFCDLETNASKIKPIIREKVREFREALDEQYDHIFGAMADIAVKLPASDVGRPLPSTAGQAGGDWSEEAATPMGPKTVESCLIARK